MNMILNGASVAEGVGEVELVENGSPLLGMMIGGENDGPGGGGGGGGWVPVTGDR